MSEPKLTTEEASEYLWDKHNIDRKAGTLMVKRVRGGGPAFLKIGRQIRYLPSQLDAWAAQITSAPMTSTSAPLAPQAA